MPAERWPLGTGPASAQAWSVAALVHAVGDAVHARFNPVTVRGEVSGFKRAASGHCYFALKDGDAQLRCALFRRNASLLDFSPRDGDQVQARGRLAVYEARGDLQLVVESLQRSGQGALFEAFVRLKARLEAQGLFDAAHKRALPPFPRGIGLVTSPQAAALHDVLSTLARRAPQVPVTLAPAAVQGAAAPAALQQALQQLYAQAEQTGRPVDVILLVRGGGSMEDLWAFNDEALAHTIAASPVPVVCGVGHETDFTIADFVADLRAPTPTAAAELVCAPRDQQLLWLQDVRQQLAAAVRRRLDNEAQRLDSLSATLGRPSAWVAGQRLRLLQLQGRLQRAGQVQLQAQRCALDPLQTRLQPVLRPTLAATQTRLDELLRRLRGAGAQQLATQRQRLAQADLRLALLDPQLVLQRGYAWLEDASGRPVTRVGDAAAGDALTARLSDGRLDVAVTARKPG